MGDAILDPFMWNHEKTDKHGYPTSGIKVGQSAITFTHGQFVRVKISSVKQAHHESDGPVVRVSNGEYSWRVDGDKYAYVLQKHSLKDLRAATKALTKTDPDLAI